MARSLDIDDLIKQHGWSPVGDIAPEGDAMRQEVEVEDGRAALLYRWVDTVAAERAALAHELIGSQLFAVPEKLSSGHGWLLVEKPDGIPATTLLPGGESHRLAELPPAKAKELAYGVGMVARKLHAVPLKQRVGDILGPVEDGPPRTWLTFSGYVAHQLEWFAENLRGQPWTEQQTSALNTSISDLRHELSAFHPRNPVCLCHGKLSFEHVWLDPSGREVVGLTGFDRAALLPRESDLAFLLWIDKVGTEPVLAKALYEGYGAARTMDVQRRERFFRRLVAFEALLRAKGDVAVSSEELMMLTSPKAIA